MSSLAALVLILVSMALLLVMGGDGQIEVFSGLDGGQIASLAALGAFGIVMASWALNHFRHRKTLALPALAFWMMAVTGLVALYTYRFELEDTANRILGSVAPGYAVTARDGEVSVTRGGGGHFALRGQVNGKPVRFLFDTGASTVVLEAGTAALLGLTPEESAYTARISTANGMTTAAPVTLKNLSIGPITQENIRALIARPGALRENLLGMSFLERLDSYEVRGDRLTLRER